MITDAFALVLTTLPADHDVDAFATHLVDERLAACVSVLAPMQSVYRWQGTVERAAERQVLIKTTAARLAALHRRVQELHPYDVPEIITLSATGSDAYVTWVGDCCRA